MIKKNFASFANNVNNGISCDNNVPVLDYFFNVATVCMLFAAVRAPVGRKAPEKKFCRAPPFLALKVLCRFGERFHDGQYSLVSFLFAVLLLTVPPCPAFCKNGGHVSSPFPIESAPLLYGNPMGRQKRDFTGMPIGMLERMANVVVGGHCGRETKRNWAKTAYRTHQLAAWLNG